MNHPDLQAKTFILLLVLATIAFGWILMPYFGAIFWGAVLAILFAPFHRRMLSKLSKRPGLAALATLAICLLLVILPLILIAISLAQEGTALYQKVVSGDIDIAAFLQKIFAALPAWMHDIMGRFGMDSMGTLQAKLSDAALEGSRFIATNMLNVGMNAFDFVVSFFVMVYLLFFLLKDGNVLARRIQRAVPLSGENKRELFEKFTTVIRATVKGNFLVAAAQGAMGGLAFWMLGIQAPLLWAVVMAFLSLLPAVGAALVWGPVALYLFAIGAFWKGAILTAFGVLVIGMIDNVLRPVLVGKDIKMPDYLVLISTIGGMAIFGLNGFVIGPVVAALFIALWDIFSSQKSNSSAS
ncbi:AI-2E family transporter [Massilia psychrophila]|uniref:AI-2E family transporter n=1 Tax=Massilia psychrophila TaxID=1603353 RepID=A0A2G8T0F0_9BURK|nr:AI-2E family transporter [Massilia psychrophila]PIL39520.1 AI-2E family transporter [Massilia psychrophila]GGE79614.1 AI-2E family transporter [Massilia psychrophila]